MSFYSQHPPRVWQFRPSRSSEEKAMNFILRYRGPLTTGSHQTDDKNFVRSWLHPQLQQLCRTREYYQKALLPDLPVVQPPRGGARPDVPRGTEFYCVRLGGYEFVPLLCRHGLVVCQLDVTWLRREEPGHVLVGGDIDNRLKTLFDGLTIPQEEA